MYIKIRTKHSKRFQVGRKNSVQGINGTLSEMLENPENQIQLPGEINVSRWTIRKTLKNCPNVEYSKGQKAHSRKEHHIKARFSWAKKYDSFGEKWSAIIFTDEKKWNLDGPHGFHCYWHDLKKEKKIFKNRQSEGGSVMTWGAFCSNGIFKLVLVSGNMDSKQYTDMLTEHFLEDFFRVAGNRAIFQQENAPIHKCVKAFKSIF